MKKVVILALILIVLVIVIILLWPVKLKHRNWVMSLAFSPDGQLLASSGYDYKVRLWDVPTGKQKMKLSEKPGAVGFLNSGKTLVKAGGGKAISFWDIASSTKISEMADDCHSKFLAISKKEDVMIAADAGIPVHLKVWDLVAHKMKYETSNHDRQIYNLSISHDSRYFGVGENKGPIYIYEVASGQEIYHYKFEKGDNRGVVCFSPYNNLVALGKCGTIVGGSISDKHGRKSCTSGPDNNSPEVIIFDFDKKQEVLRLNQIYNLEYMVFLPPDGKMLATLGGAVQIWDLNNGKEISHFVYVTEEQVDCYAVSPDGKIMAVGATDGRIQLFDMDTGDELPQSR